MAADADVFFNQDEFADPATYNGDSIKIVPEIGLTLQSGDTIQSNGSSDRAVFYIKTTDVSDPAGGDLISHKGKNWEVVRLIESDETTHSVECVSNVSPHRRW